MFEVGDLVCHKVIKSLIARVSSIDGIDYFIVIIGHNNDDFGQCYYVSSLDIHTNYEEYIRNYNQIWNSLNEI